MTVKITIIGMGQIGASIGLALGTRKDLFTRMGHDKSSQIANRAKALGAVDKVDFNLPNSVDGAAIIILAIPQDQIHDTLGYIAEDIQEDAVIMDTSPVKGEVFQWIKEKLPPKRHYIGLTPVLNPTYLETSGFGVETAHEDLFKNGLMAIYLPPGLPPEAIKLATDFTQLLGAEHMFIDPIELDGLIVGTHILPQLIAAALLNSTVDQPGWQDARKLTGRPYAFATEAIAMTGEVSSLTSMAISNQENLLRKIGELIENLELIRQQLAAGEAEKLAENLESARLRREKWLKERTSANWAANETASSVALPTSKQVFSQMFTFGGFRKPKPPNKNPEPNKKNQA